MADKLVINCTTGEVVRQPLTADEQAQAESDAAAAAARMQAEAAADAADETDRQAWRDAVSKAASIADLKAVLLGSNTPVAPVVDRKPR